MQVGEAFVAVRPDTSKFGPELQRGVESSGRQAASGLSQALTAGIAVAGFSKLVGAASDLTEAANKVQATFGSASGEVESFASTSAASLGIAESAALDLAGGIGSMLIPLGISQEEAAGMSTRMLQLAADMGSFNNQDPTEMLERIRSGLAGETEPLRQFGANLTEARIQQFAWQEGIAESGVALTEQQKVLARYGLLLQDTSIQQGDFAATSDEAANAQRIAAATAQDSAASIGENFLPVYKQAVAAVSALAGVFGSLPGPLQTAAVLFAGFAAFKGPLTGAFSAISAAAQGMAERFRAAGGGISGFSSLVTPGALGVGAAVVGIGLITSELAKNAERAEEARRTVKELGDAFTSAGSAGVAETLFSQLSEDAPEVIDSLDAAGVSLRDFAEGALGNLDTSEMERLSAVIDGLPVDQALELTGRLAALPSAIEDVAQGQSTLEQTTTGATATLDDQASALSDVADSADAARDALGSLFGVQQTLDEAAVGVQAATDDLSQSLRDNGRSFNIATEAGRSNVQAAREAASSIREYTIAARANGDTVQQAAGKGRALIASLRDTLRAAGMTKAETDRLISTYARVPRSVLTDVQVTGADAAVSAIQRIYSAAVRAAAAVNQIGGSLAGGGAYGESAPGESFAPGMTERWAPTVVVQVQGSMVGDVDRFADEIAYRAAEKLSMTGGF